MFKRKFRFRKKRFGTFRRAPSTRTLQKTKASKRYNWVPLLDSTCSVTFLPPRACMQQDEVNDFRPHDIDCADGTPIGLAASPVYIDLVPPSTLVDGADLYGGDDITIARLVGYVQLQPYFVMLEPFLSFFTGSPEHTQTALLTLFRKDRNMFVRAALRKEEFFWDQNTKVWGNHPRDPFNTEEWSETKWLKRWSWDKPPGSLGGHTQSIAPAGNPQGICSDVHTAGLLDNSFTDGNGTINVETDCSSEETTVPSATAGTWTVPDRPLRLSLSSRRRIRLRESQGLGIWLNYASIDYSRPLEPECNSWFHQMAVGFAVRSHVRALIET